MARTVSSSFTFAAMFSGPFFATAAGLLALCHYVLDTSFTPSKVQYVIFMCAMIGAVGWVSFIWHRSRRVRVDNDNFYVSNYLLKEIMVPLVEVATVTQVIYSRSHFIELNLNYRTRLGQTVRFMPPAFDNARFGLPHPLADELRAIIDAKKRPAVAESYTITITDS